LKLLAGNIGNNTTSNMIEVNITGDNALDQVTVPLLQQPSQIQQQPSSNTTTCQISLNDTMTGTDPVTQIQKTVNGMNGLSIWNANVNQAITLYADNSANVTVLFKKAD
jgi:hypothetical protein